MIEQQKQRIEQEMTRMVDDVDRSYIRKMQAKMHRCAANCCENQELSIERVHQCVERCGTSLSGAQSYVQKELQHFQSRLERCIMECNDEAKDKMGANPSEQAVAKFTAMFENCAVKCVDKYVGLIPGMTRSIKGVLEKQSSENI